MYTRFQTKTAQKPYPLGRHIPMFYIGECPPPPPPGLSRGRIQKIQKEGAEETADAVLHHSWSICDQTLGLTLRTFQKYRKKGGGGGRGTLAPP